MESLFDTPIGGVVQTVMEVSGRDRGKCDMR